MAMGDLGNAGNVDEGAARLSMKIALVLSSIWLSNEERSPVSAQRTCQSKLLKAWPNWLIEPP